MFHKALAIRPNYAEVYNNLGSALQERGRLEEAVASYRKAIALKPDFAEAHSNLLFCLNYHPDLSAEAIFAEYQRWNEVHARPVLKGDVSHGHGRDPERRLRVGYVSPDLRQHSARHFIEPLLSHHDKTQVEVFAYAQVAAEDAVSARLKGYTDHWINTVGMSDEALAQMIRRDGIDILIDLAGHTAGNRLLVFARKPAPIQMSWMGYGYTTGLEAIDYFLGDAAFTPQGCEPVFSERIVRLPAFAAYRPDADMGEPGPSPVQQTGSITFGSLSRSIRINHRVIRTWAALLQRVPGSRLIINSRNLQSASQQAEMQQRFAQYGTGAERLLLGYDSPPWDLLRKIDISLDCFPHNSGTTLIESLYMGVPYVTLAERPSVGCIGSSFLRNAGHPEWIAATEAEYVDKAAALAANKERLASLRANLRGQVQASLLMDEAGFARSVETACRDLWRQWCVLKG
ncbi:MAG: tetratricopeptide repeat protein [Gammaproteobacteria bacterium]|nr:tetratricopeptide repeat protein [Gammaproteobacteria bacterium]